ncbi:hypothetical protein CLAIMM_09189 [Cladophialophora immunda]|nr:hypothetical protein CLAIMM_09189 [Cladophialophora immunda]
MTSMHKVFAAYEARKAVLEKSTNPLAQGVAWVEGQLYPIHEARIPLLDQGFLHSDLTYDVPSVWDGRFFRLDDHLSRLEKSCAKMRLTLPVPRDEIKRILCDMVAKSGMRDAFVELIVTRGLKGVRGAQRPQDLTNSLYLFILPYIWVMEPEMQLEGSGKAIIARTVRRTPPGCMDPTVKNLQWGDLTRGMLEASDRGANYPFLTDGDGNITEGSGFNIVLIKDGSVFDVAQKLGLDVRLDFVPVELAYHCDEMFMCTTAGGIMPITSLDGVPVRDGKVGPLTAKIWDLYWDMHYDPTYSFAIDYDGAKTNGVNGAAH